MTRNVISAFIGEWEFLSNYFVFPVVIDGLEYPSAEHAYQAAKTEDAKWRELIRQARNPDSAKRLGRASPHRTDWESVKVEVMHKVVAAKFSSSEMRARLISTGGAELVEGNDWGDVFWGQCNEEGANHMGRILMEVRAQIRDV